MLFFFKLFHTSIAGIL